MDIKGKIHQYGMTPTQVAEKMGIKAPTLSKMLKNQSSLKMSSIERIAEAIGCNVSDLVSDTDSKDKESKMVCPHCGKVFTIEIHE